MLVLNESKIKSAYGIESDINSTISLVVVSLASASKFGLIVSVFENKSSNLNFICKSFLEAFRI